MRLLQLTLQLKDLPNGTFSRFPHKYSPTN